MRPAKRLNIFKALLDILIDKNLKVILKTLLLC